MSTDISYGLMAKQWAVREQRRVDEAIGAPPEDPPAVVTTIPAYGMQVPGVAMTAASRCR